MTIDKKTLTLLRQLNLVTKKDALNAKGKKLLLKLLTR